MTTSRRGLRVAGKVQGVGFRWWTKSQAHDLGVSGWVRNDPDGTVEVLLRGEPERVGEMAARLREGPRGAEVASVEPAELPDRVAAAAGFEIVH